jgi:hypothetical protein
MSREAFSSADVFRVADFVITVAGEFELRGGIRSQNRFRGSQLTGWNGEENLCPSLSPCCC